MSLAFLADVRGKGGESRFTAAVGLLMTGSLLLAAYEQTREDTGGRWWLPLGCALACACWCLLACRGVRRRPLVRLQASREGLLRLVSGDTGEVVDAVFVGGWSLGWLICLRLEPVTKVDPAAAATNRRQWLSCSGSTGWRFLLARRSFDEASWHAVRRWLVWCRRSRRRETGAA